MVYQHTIFAHAVDDHLMRVTHVIRADEWLSSVPLHLELFKALGFAVPKYAHTSAILKDDEGKKRKISKRKESQKQQLVIIMKKEYQQKLYINIY